MTDTTQGDFGYSRLQPQDYGSDFNSAARLIDEMMGRMVTMRLVQVVAVHSNGALAAAGTVDVLPLVSMVDGNGNVTKHITVNGIPWFRLQGGKNAVIMDPQVDDIGYVDVSDRDISNVKKNFAQSPPGSYRTFDIADGIYVGGCLNNVSPNQAVAFLSTGIKIFDLNGNVIEMTSAGITITGNVTVTGTLTVDQLEVGGAGLNITGNITATGDITAGLGGIDQVGVRTHKHPTAVSGPPSSPTPGT